MLLDGFTFVSLIITWSRLLGHIAGRFSRGFVTCVAHHEGFGGDERVVGVVG